MRAVCAEETLPLYAGSIPNAIDASDEESVRDPNDRFPFLLNISRPTITAYPLPLGTAPTAAVLIFPGGSYAGVSIVKEGHDVARAFNAMGVAAFVVKYRMPNPKYMSDRTLGPLQDAQQAMRVVRSRAIEWNIDPQRVGIVGFSAGGHLAATAAMFFDQPVVSAPTLNLRPDFLVLLYPVVSMSDELTHRLSRTNFLGESPSAELKQRYSMELNVHPRAPTTFLMHAADDKSVKVENTLRLFEALQAKQIPTEMHIYPHGGHGFGLNNATTQDQWIEHCRHWLASQGIVAKD
jgi:acetyl esterase/lipase